MIMLLKTSIYRCSSLFHFWRRHNHFAIPFHDCVARESRKLIVPPQLLRFKCGSWLPIVHRGNHRHHTGSADSASSAIRYFRLAVVHVNPYSCQHSSQRLALQTADGDGVPIRSSDCEFCRTLVHVFKVDESHVDILILGLARNLVNYTIKVKIFHIPIIHYKRLAR